MKRVTHARMLAVLMPTRFSAFRKSLLLPRCLTLLCLTLLCLTMVAALTACGGSSNSANTPTTIPDGNYVYSLAGSGTSAAAGANVAHPLYFVAGVFTVANGVISAGEQDITDPNTNDFDQINPTGSTIAKTPDGNLQITLTTCQGTACASPDQRVGVKGVETLNGSFLPLNPSKALITEFDASFSGSGTLELQSAASSTPSGGYAFNLFGLDKVGNPVTIGGVIDIAAGKITALGSIFDLNDIGVSPYIFALQNFAEGSVSSPDTFGRVTFTLNPQTSFNPIILVGYIVDANHIRLVETDDQYDGSLGGAALSQGANVTTFSSASVAGNSYVVGLTGFEHANNIGALQVAGVLTFNSDGSVTGFLNHNDATGSGVEAPVAITGTYTVDSLTSGAPDAGTGRVTVTIPSPLLTLQLYLDGSGHALAATMDSTDALGGLGFQQTGGPSFTTASFNGASVLDATGVDINKTGEFDAVGPITANGSAATFSGTADLNWLNSTGPTYPDLSISGTVSTTNGAAASGVFTGTITGLDVTTKTNADAFSFYLIDSTGDFIAIETDPNQLTLGYFNQR